MECAQNMCALYQFVSTLQQVLFLNISYQTAYYLSNLGSWLSTIDYEVVPKIFRTGTAIYTAVVVARSTVDGRTTMSSESVCQVARSWVDVGSFHTRLVVRFMMFTASVRNILDTASCLTS
jgi:hypothetical protein